MAEEMSHVAAFAVARLRLTCKARGFEANIEEIDMYSYEGIAGTSTI